MKTLKQLCKPRESVFDNTRRDVVLDLTNLVENNIDADAFFAENYLTDGMKTLLREAFRRFSDGSSQGIYVLTQAMGGGKTHNMVALGLLAKHPELRKHVMGDLYQAEDLGNVDVVAFSGRESDAQFGIWGAIAKQLNKEDVLKDHYQPLKAPGQTAWTNLLQGKPLLILLDELPPYLESARSQTIGNSDLSRETTTALANLFVAVSRDQLSNVCIVISDLKATYEEGSQRISSALDNLQRELGRTATTLEPVALNTDEVYHILRKRLFEELPDEKEIIEVARGYAQAVKDAKQMDITNASPEKFAQQIKDSYPFHFAIKDLYARFRENPGFQQTRGLIRLMRVIVARMFSEESEESDRLYLIHAHNLDLNDRATLAEVTQINPTLENAISHDIASNGQAMAEIIDTNLNTTDAEDVSKLLLVSSLANIPNAILGLSVPEIVSYLCAPGREISKLKQDILKNLSTSAWYLHSNTEGKLYFKNTQNLVAKLKSEAESYNRETSLRELRTFLAGIFSPSMKDCYQEVLALPLLDQIDMKQDKVTLVISEPYMGGGLRPEIQQLYDDMEYKNRIMFLSGERGTLETLLESAAQLKAIESILLGMDAEKIADNDPQRSLAKEMRDTIKFRLLSAIRENFTTIRFPNSTGLMTADFYMGFTDNNYNGERQVRETLKQKQKFTDDISSDTFRKKCEQRLFTQKVMLWSEIKKRAATNIGWQWHKPDALDMLKTDLIAKDFWRQDGNTVEKPPFPLPQTEVFCKLKHRDESTGLATLELIPVNGDTIHYEVGSSATTASLVVDDPKKFQTNELEVSFLCVDSKNEHETGQPILWRNQVTIRSRQYGGDSKMMELEVVPSVPLRYSTNGSDPKVAGGSYDGSFFVPKGSPFVLVVAEKNGEVYSEQRVDISWDTKSEFKVAVTKAVTWKHTYEIKTTKESYEFLALLKKHNVSLPGPRISVVGSTWMEVTCDDKVVLDGEKLDTLITNLRLLLTEGQVTIEADILKFPSGQSLLDWIEDVKIELQPKEVMQ